jgi:hypothetical protein
MSSTGDGSATSSNWDEVVDDAPTRDIRSTLALGGNGRKKGVVVTDEAELEQLRQELEKLTPEEREQLRMLASQRVLNSFRDEVSTRHRTSHFPLTSHTSLHPPAP